MSISLLSKNPGNGPSFMQYVANQHVMISHQRVEAISTTKQEAKWKQSRCKMEAKAWNI
jgi:hypothetical protein